MSIFELQHGDVLTTRDTNGCKGTFVATGWILTAFKDKKTAVLIDIEETIIEVKRDGKMVYSSR